MEKTKADLRILYFLIFYCFVENKSIKQAYINTTEFFNDLKIETISYSHISKIFRILRLKIMEKMRQYWNNNLIGLYPADNGKDRIEIDESKVITYDGDVRWMFGLVDRGHYDIRIYYVNNNRLRDTLLPLVKENCYTYYNTLLSNNDENENYPATRIYSDCFQPYQINDFYNCGYILNRVNHLIWFGQGSFHTNNVEGVWSKIKRWNNDFVV